MAESVTSLFYIITTKLLIMKTITISLAMAFTTLMMNAQTVKTISAEGTTITVTVAVQSEEGSVMFSLNKEDTFMKQPFKIVEGKIVDGKATITFENVKPGTYGILLFHDKNGNKQMDFEPNGMPIEPYGVSNNNMSMGPPQWNDAKFEVTDKPVVLDIRM